jgi:hypothetical protein
MNMTNQNPATDDTVLMQILNFNQSDLEANRQGLMSPAQRDAIRQEHFARASAWGLGALIPIAVVVVRPQGTEGLGIWLFVIFAAVCVGFSLWQIFNLQSILAQNELKHVEGQLSYPLADMLPRRASPPYIEVDGEEFNVTLPVQKAFVPGWTYRLYYLPSRQRLLSAEVISDK